MAMVTAVFEVDGMSCEHCVMTITDALMELEGVEDVDVELDSEEEVTVTYDDEEVDEEDLVEAIEDAGYEVR
ncbi:MAG: copper ion binding protein [Halanaerobium sp.]|nr:copper ion binding protein [Halanaerobium sp.]